MRLARRVTILGATGSIGANTAAVIEEILAGGGEISVEALTGGKNIAALAALARRLKPRFLAIGDPDLLADLRASVSLNELKKIIDLGAEGAV